MHFSHSVSKLQKLAFIQTTARLAGCNLKHIEPSQSRVSVQGLPEAKAGGGFEQKVFLAWNHTRRFRAYTDRVTVVGRVQRQALQVSGDP